MRDSPPAHTRIVRGIGLWLAATLTLPMLVAPPAAHGGHEFLLDGQMMADSFNAQRSPVQARKYDLNPVLTSQFPWETSSAGLERVTSPTIWVDHGANILRMLYWATEPGGDNIIRCAAESPDGRTWTRTMMDQHPYGSYAETNIAVMNPPSPYTGVSDFWVLENPRPDLLPNSAYIALTEFRNPRHTFIITSTDGLHWDKDNRYLVTDQKNDTHPSIIMGPDGKFRAFIRGRIAGHRIVDMVESTDLVNWSGRTTVMDIGADIQAYGMPVRELDGVYVALMPTLRVDENVGNGIGPMYCEIVTSRNSIDWARDFPETPVIDNGPDGSWDAGIAYHNAGILEWQDRWITAYGGGPLLHGQYSPLRVGVAEFDRGRLFQTVQSDPGAGGWILTKPLVTNGASLVVNADLAGGSLRVSVVDAAGQVLAGYEADQSTLTLLDDLRYAVTWPTQTVLPEGKWSLRIDMDAGASLYAFEGPDLYAPPPPPAPPPMIASTEVQRFHTAARAAADGWTALDNTAGGNDYGWAATSHAGGGAGEAGGRFARVGTFNYYADTSIGTIDTLDHGLHATGRLMWDNDNEWTAGHVIGWFNTEDEGHYNVVGFVLNDPATEGFARAEPRFYFDTGAHDRYLPPVEIPAGVELTFDILYDPHGGAGFGVLRIEFFAEGVSLGVGEAVLGAADRAEGISLNAFGISTRGIHSASPDLWADVYFDDLEYATLVPAVHGDATLDGAVDDDDLSLLLAHWSGTGEWADGNFNGDETINDDDLSLLLAHWTGPLDGVIPEPATVAILVVGALAVGRDRRRARPDGREGAEGPARRSVALRKMA